MTPSLLESIFGKHLPPELERLPAYRLRQITHAVFRELVSDWSEATALPKELQARLSEIWPLTWPVDTFTSKDRRSHKSLVTLADGAKVESVLMRYPKRNSVCISCQVGCAVGCSFCATGTMGLTRNLTAWEMVNQVLQYARTLKRRKAKVTNVVFMGMGEPMLNYDRVLAAIRILNQADGLKLGQRHISISTSGIVPGIKKFAREGLEVNLAISLHAPNDTLRTKLMRINKAYPLASVIREVKEYTRLTRRRVMFEYIMIEGVNDSLACAKQLATLMRQPLFFVNVIPYNPTGVYSPSSRRNIEQFIAILEAAGVTVTQRFTFGQDINAACGQLATAQS